MDQLTEKAIQEAVAPLQKQIAALDAELKKLKSAKPSGLVLPKGTGFRPVRITREGLLPMVEAHDLDQDGSVSLDEALAFAQKLGPSWAGERIGLLLQSNYQERKTPPTKGGK